MYNLFPSRGRNTTTDRIAALLAVTGNSHEVALKMIVFLRHFCPKGRSQQVSESSSRTWVDCDADFCCKVEKTLKISNVIKEQKLVQFYNDVLANLLLLHNI